MIIFNPRRLVDLRGIRHPVAYLMKHGFGRSTASNLLTFKTPSVRFDHLEKLCLLLKCTPNDLFEWKPGKDAADDTSHPLNSLKRSTTTRNIADIVDDLPIDKLEQVEGLLDQLRSEN